MIVGPRNSAPFQKPSKPPPMNTMAEGDAGKRRAERQRGERDQHHLGRFVRRVVVAMPVIVVPVIVHGRDAAAGKRADQSPRSPKNVMNIRRQE